MKNEQFLSINLTHKMGKNESNYFKVKILIPDKLNEYNIFPHIWFSLKSDKCCIQHGRTARGTITLLKSYKDTNYSVVINGIGGSSNSANTNVSWVTGLVNVGSKTTTSFSFNNQGYGVPNNCNWITIGYIN